MGTRHPQHGSVGCSSSNVGLGYNRSGRLQAPVEVALFFVQTKERTPVVEEQGGWRNKQAANVFTLSTQLNGLPVLMNIEEFYTNWNWFSRTVFQRPSPERLPGHRCGPSLCRRRAQSAGLLRGMSTPVPLRGELWEMQAGGVPKKGDCWGGPRPVGWCDGHLQSCWASSAAEVSRAIS